MGLGFMVFAMLLETALFVIRTTTLPQLHYTAELWGKRSRQAHTTAAAAPTGALAAAREAPREPRTAPSQPVLEKKDK